MSATMLSMLLLMLSVPTRSITLLRQHLGGCCDLGTRWADDQKNGCDNFPVPVADVPTELQTLCVTTVEICCTSQRRSHQCHLGLRAGQTGRQCLRLSGVGGDAFQDCCLGCKMGLQASSKVGDDDGTCRDLAGVFQHPWDTSFISCCEEIRNGTFTEPDDAHAGSVGLEEATRVTMSRMNRCPIGFRYNSRLNVCDDVDECADESHDCDTEFEACYNTIGGFICEEIEGNVKNKECPKGFRFFLVDCIDIDECSEVTHDCSEDELCVNDEGGYHCRDLASLREGNCPVGYQYNYGQRTCEDVNECSSGQHDCLESQRCDNTMGSFTCVRFTACGTGYTLNHDTGRCEDDDECALGTHNCEALGPGYLCLNLQGTFRCEKRRCSLGEILGDDGVCAPLRCQLGFEPGPAGNCIDVDECATYYGEEGVCPPGQRCVNTMGSFDCVSKCPLGLQLDPSGVSGCTDVDECALGVAACFGGRQCVNTIGSYRCSCPNGFTLSQSSGRCEDIDECSTSQSRCTIDSECQNSVGSFRCVCKPGFTLKGDDGSCVDVDECAEIESICQQRCTNLWGSYRCHCEPGFRLSSDGRSCIDVDECRDYDGLCIGHCVNEPGSYRCSCPQGYILSSNGRSCQDVDECLAERNPCGSNLMHCFNTRGGYKCHDISCPEGYAPEQGHKRRCRKLETRCLASDERCLRKPVSVSHNFIALISNLKVRGQGVNLFTMQSARYRLLTTRFSLTVKEARALSSEVGEVAGAGHFRLRTGSHSAVLALVRPIQGPQDIVLELLMEMYHQGRFQASAAANIYIYVTAYEF